MRRRTELSADVIHRQLVGCDRHTVLLIAERFALLDDTGYGNARPRRAHAEVDETLSQRTAGRNGVRQVDVLGAAEGRI